MIEVKPTIEFIKDLAFYSGRIVMRIRAEGPLKCEDPEKIKLVWRFYEEGDKIPYQILDELISYGDCYCYFSTINEAQTNAANWFPPLSLLLDSEYDLDQDYYIAAECVDENGRPIIGF